jgi:hypothetical protein
MAWGGLATHLSLAAQQGFFLLLNERSPTEALLFYKYYYCMAQLTRWEASSKAPAFPACFPFGCCRTPSRSFLLALIILPANQPVTVRRED